MQAILATRYPSGRGDGARKISWGPIPREKPADAAAMTAADSK